MIARFAFGFALAALAVVIGCSSAESTPSQSADPTPTGRAGEDAAAIGDAAASTFDAADATAPSDADAALGKDANGSCTPIFAPGTACADCVNDLCTAELAACNGDCDCLALEECDTDCILAVPPTDWNALTACMDVCKAQHPVGHAKFLPLASCSYARCSATADGGTGACK